MTDLTLTPISATTLNDNFNSIEDAVNAKAELNGNSTQKFEVADAIEQTEAVNKKQLDDAVSSINSTIFDLDAEIDTGLAAKLDESDTTITKQGNTFNSAGQLVLLNESGQLPALDGSLLTNISAATLDTSNMPAIENSSTDANNDINVLSGFCWDDSLTIKLQLSSTLTKQLDAAWVSGSNAGGLDAGSKAVSTWYHVFLISNGTNTDVLFSTSAVSPTMPDGYSYKRRIGSIKTNSGGNICGFKQHGGYFEYTNNILLEVNDNSLGTSAKIYTLNVPSGVRVTATINTDVYNSSYSTVKLGSTFVTDFSNSRGCIRAMQGSNYAEQAAVRVITDTNAQIKAIAEYSNVNIKMSTVGYLDLRGAK